MDATPSDLLLINRLLLHLYRALTPEDQLQAMFRVVSELVPNDFVGWTEFNLANRDVRFISFPAHKATEKQINDLGTYAHQMPFPAHFAATGNRSWMMLSDFIPLEELRTTDVYAKVLGPMKINYELAVVLDNIEDMVFSLTIQREHQPFSERDRAVLNLIQPHLNLSYYNAHAIAKAHRSVRELQSVVQTAPAGYAYLQTDGRIEWVTPKARELWRRFYPGDATDKGGVPTSVRSWLRGMVAEAATNRRLSARDVVTIRQGDERMEMRLVPSQLGGLVLSVDSRSTVLRPRFHPLLELSDRENDVLSWMAEGKRNAEIATILGISPRTVERHVGAVLEKLGVENRATAIVLAMELAAGTDQTVSI